MKTLSRSEMLDSIFKMVEAMQKVGGDSNLIPKFPLTREELEDSMTNAGLSEIVLMLAKCCALLGLDAVEIVDIPWLTQTVDQAMGAAESSEGHTIH